MLWFEPRTPIYSGAGEELEKVQQLLTDHQIPFKLKKGTSGTLVLVKRSLGDQGEMLIREAKARRWLW